MKQNLIGLVWRNIPKISQHKLSYSSNANDFENWCNETINDYQKLNIEYALLAKDETKFLNDLGCSKVVIVPDAVAPAAVVEQAPAVTKKPRAPAKPKVVKPAVVKAPAAPKKPRAPKAT